MQINYKKYSKWLRKSEQNQDLYKKNCKRWSNRLCSNKADGRHAFVASGFSRHPTLQQGASNFGAFPGKALVRCVLTPKLDISTLHSNMFQRTSHSFCVNHQIKVPRIVQTPLISLCKLQQVQNNKYVMNTPWIVGDNSLTNHHLDHLVRHATGVWKNMAAAPSCIDSGALTKQAQHLAQSSQGPTKYPDTKWLWDIVP
jgi:hypothetical protein